MTSALEVLIGFTAAVALSLIVSYARDDEAYKRAKEKKEEDYKKEISRLVTCLNNYIELKSHPDF